jgi:hypothetical protein
MYGILCLLSLGCLKNMENHCRQSFCLGFFIYINFLCDRVDYPFWLSISERNIIKVCRISVMERIDINCVICIEDIHEMFASFVDKIERYFIVSLQSWSYLSEIMISDSQSMAILYDMHYSLTVFKSLCFTNIK